MTRSRGEPVPGPSEAKVFLGRLDKPAIRGGTRSSGEGE